MQLSVMTLLFALIISIVVFIVAFIIYRIALEILEEKQFFWAAIWGFFVLYAVAAVAVYFLVPRLDKTQPTVEGLLDSYFNMLPSQVEDVRLEEQSI
jgi:ATP/ADP translocase